MIERVTIYGVKVGRAVKVDSLSGVLRRDGSVKVDRRIEVFDYGLIIPADRVYYTAEDAIYAYARRLEAEIQALYQEQEAKRELRDRLLRTLS